MMTGDFGFDPDSLQTMPDCMKESSQRIASELKNMDQEERVEFTRELTKELADTDCATILLNFLPYDLVIDELDKASH